MSTLSDLNGKTITRAFYEGNNVVLQLSDHTQAVLKGVTFIEHRAPFELCFHRTNGNTILVRPLSFTEARRTVKEWWGVRGDTEEMMFLSRLMEGDVFFNKSNTMLVRATPLPKTGDSVDL